MKLVQWMAAIAFFSASCDVVLAISLGGTVRLAQLMLLGLIVCAFARMIQKRTILWPQGGYALAVWCVLQGLLLTQSPAPGVSAQLYVLLLFTIAGMYAMLQLYGLSPRLESLMKIYLLSYVAVAAFGLFQFVAPALHLGHPLIVQWIIHGLIPRISGFNYEPSYFATYMVMGWITLVDLRLSKAALTSSRPWLWATILTGLVLFLSTSKTAWMLMIIEVLARVFPYLLFPLRRMIGRLRAGRLLIPLPRVNVIAGLVALFFAASAFLAGLSRLIDPNYFLSGTGLNGTPAHSLNDRLGGFHATLAVIEMHPFIGRSLGGVAGSIANLLGYQVTTVDELHHFWGFPVPLDVFAASGLWGFIPFAWFFWQILWRDRELIRGNLSDERTKWLRALMRGLVFEWLALCADQNLLRLYFWFHVTMVVIVAYNLRYGAAGQASAEGLVTA